MIAAAALLVAFGTSHVALVYRARLKPGQVLLVLGAAGGVGLAAVQIGKIWGAIVIAVARGTEKIHLLKSMEVDHVVDLGGENVISSVKEFIKKMKLKHKFLQCFALYKHECCLSMEEVKLSVVVDHWEGLRKFGLPFICGTLVYKFIQLCGVRGNIKAPTKAL